MKRQTVSASIIIDAPPEVVWEVAADPNTYVETIDWVYEVWREDEGPIRQGSVYVERAKPGPKEGIYRWEVTAFEPHRRMVHAHAGSELEAELEILLEQMDGGRTRYAQIMQFRAMPGFRPLGFLLERTIMKRNMQRDMDQMILPNIKRLVEQRTSSPQRTGREARQTESDQP